MRPVSHPAPPEIRLPGARSGGSACTRAQPCPGACVWARSDARAAGRGADNVHAQVGFDFGAESAFARATVDTDISNKAAVAAATWFQRGACLDSQLCLFLPTMLLGCSLEDQARGRRRCAPCEAAGACEPQRAGRPRGLACEGLRLSGGRARREPRARGGRHRARRQPEPVGRVSPPPRGAPASQCCAAPVRWAPARPARSPADAPRPAAGTPSTTAPTSQTPPGCAT